HAPSALRRHIRRGGLIAYPTESCYGIGANPRHAHALRAILRLKKRPQHKGFITIGNNLAQLETLLQRQPENVRAQLRQHTRTGGQHEANRRGPCGLQLRGNRRSKLAVRVPDHAVARELCRIAGTPLVSTSCNQSGKRVCKSAREVRRLFGHKLWIVGGRVGKRKQPSEIVDWAENRRLR
ncbi:MAG: L-threonylcarbamoyladenylate synthase, partial [Kingella oralis]